MDVREAIARRLRGQMLDDNFEDDVVDDYAALYADLALAALSVLVGDGALRWEERECEACEGTGDAGRYIDADAGIEEFPCPSCDGSGTVREPVVVPRQKEGNE